MNDNGMLKDVRGENRVGFVATAQCIVSCLCSLSSRSRPPAQISATRETLWTSVELAVRRLHANLGHTTVPDTRRTLQAAKAPQAVMDAPSHFSCSQCDAVMAPKISQGVVGSSNSRYSGHVAMDVNWLSGCEEDVRIKSVNMVDVASNLQHIYTFFETETSEVLLRQNRHWTRAHGRARWLKVDASRMNLGETLQRALEVKGTQLLDIPVEAH